MEGGGLKLTWTYREGICGIRNQKTRLLEPFISGWVWGESGERKRLALPTAPSPTTTPIISREHAVQERVSGEKPTFYCLHNRVTSEGRSRRVRGR